MSNENTTTTIQIADLADQLEELSGEFYSEVTRLEERFLRLADALIDKSDTETCAELREFYSDSFCGSCGSNYARSYEPLAAAAARLRDLGRCA